MLTANEARQLTVDHYALDKGSVGTEIHMAVADGQFSTVFDDSRWDDSLDEWLEELGYKVVRMHMLGSWVEVSW